MYLILSPVDINISDNTKEVLLIRQNILTFQQRQSLIDDGYKIIDNDDVYFPKEELDRINTRILDLYRKVMKSVASSLNEYNATDYSQRFWNIAVGRRVYDMICRYYISYRQVEKAKTKYDTLTANIVFDETPSFERDYLHFTTNQYIIYSHLLRNTNDNIKLYDSKEKLMDMAKSFEMNYLKQMESVYMSHTGRVQKRLEALKQQIKLLLEKMALTNAEVLLDTPYMDNILILTIASGFRIMGTESLFIFKDANLCSCKQYSGLLKMPSLDFVSNDDFETIIKKYVFEWIPAIFSEFFNKAEEEVYPLYSRCNAKIVGSANSYVYNDIYNLWMAHMADKGCKTIAMDHGGTVCVDYNAEHEYETYDFFYTYGNLKNIPRHSNFINGMCLTHFSKRAGVLNVNNYITHSRNKILYFESVDSYNPSPYKLARGDEASVFRSLEQKFRFINTIGKDDVCDLFLRTQNGFTHYESSTKYALMYENIERHTMQDVPFYSDVMRADICISDMFNGTCWQECIALDKPVLLLANTIGCVFTEYGWDMIQRMKEKNLIFEDGIYAAKYIESIFDPIKWWNETERHRLIEEFCYNYMYIPRGRNRYRQLANIFLSVGNRARL